MSSIEDELAGLQDQWKEASAGGVSLPDGKYTFKISAASVGKSQTSGRIQLACTYEVIVGEHIGKTVRNYQGLTDPTSVGWLKKNMAKLEMALPALITEIPAWCTRLVGITLIGTVKNKDGFTNLYPDKRITILPGAMPPSPTQASSGGSALGM